MGLCLGVVFVSSSVGVARAAPIPGSQGTDTSIPATDSVATVAGRDAYSDLRITVNQTANLTNQAVSITWSGGVPTVDKSARFGWNFLQVFQCWGDDDGSVPGNPGPPPEQCEQGGVKSQPETSASPAWPAGFATTRVIARTDWPGYKPGVGVVDPKGDPSFANVWMPFHAVDGTSIDIQNDNSFNPSVSAGAYWLNPKFDQFTTNELVGAATAPNGTGAELFQVLTGVEAPGLGCGQRAQLLADGSKGIPKCWIVVVPRATGAEENAGSTFFTNAGVSTSPLSPSAWSHRIAIPVEFNPVDSPCALGSQERSIVGTPVASVAVASWQPALCAGGSLPPFSYVPVGDDDARRQLLSKTTGSPRMVVVSRPIPAEQVAASNPVVYSPISLSGLVIGVNVERSPEVSAPPDEQVLSGVRVAELNLTPRLVAKLLTQSYVNAVAFGNKRPAYPWVAKNPVHLATDPDFLQFNPEFALLTISNTRNFSGLAVPGGNSDYALRLWQWVLADPEAKAWLDGAPDEWGMEVNPAYATTAAANRTGVAFGDPVPNSFPKAEPYCYQGPPVGSNGVVPLPLCGTDWMPYLSSLLDTARATRYASDGAKIAPTSNPSPLTPTETLVRSPPQTVGSRAFLSITDTAAAAKYGTQTARLSRAGDDGRARTFIAADSAGLTAGVAAMQPGSEPSVLEPQPAASAPTAYPLTIVTYAATTPLAMDAIARSQYAAFLDYVAGPGQVLGLSPGQLPRGFTPLTAALEAQVIAAAEQVRTITAPLEPTTTTAAPEPPPTSADAAPDSTPSTPGVTPDPAVDQTPPSGTSAQLPVGGTADTSSRTRTVPTRSESNAPAQPTPEQGTVIETDPVAADPDSSSTTSPETLPVGQTDGEGAQEPVATSGSSTTTGPPVTTPSTRTGVTRFAVPTLGMLALGSGIGVLEITKRPRRAALAELDDPLVDELVVDDPWAVADPHRHLDFDPDQEGLSP